MPRSTRHIPLWASLLPFFCIGMLALIMLSANGGWMALLAGAALVAAVLLAVHHAEVVAHKVGEPFGTLILAVAVTVIEVGMIVVLMLAGGPEASKLARDTVFAAVMLVSNGILGVCLLVGGWRYREQDFQIQGASSLLAVMAVLATLTLVLPSFTISAPGPTYTVPQLVFAGAASLVLYGVFVFVQTISHRDYFLTYETNEPDAHAKPPGVREAWLSFFLLVVSLIAVVGLAKALAPYIESGINALHAPKSTVGIVIALLVLLPESYAAIRAARANRLQTSLNLALGSGLASIGLTIPTVAALSVYLDRPLALGLDSRNMILLGLTFIVGTLTLGTGRTTILQGAVHLVVLGAYLVLAFIP